MSHPVAVVSASVARGSPICQPCTSRPRLPSGLFRLCSGPATKPSSEIDMWQVVSDINIPPKQLQVASGRRLYMFGNRRHFRVLQQQSEKGIASNILADRLLPT